jgi:hypothetical protein
LTRIGIEHTAARGGTPRSAKAWDWEWEWEWEWIPTATTVRVTSLRVPPS